MRVTKQFYHLIGVLALSTTNTEVLNEVFKLYEQLIKTNLLKFNKDIAMQIAVQKTIQNRDNEINAKILGDGDMISSLVNLLQLVELLPISGVISNIPFFE